MAGFGIWLLPGAALAWRLLGSGRPLLLAPVLSMSVLMVAAIVGDVVFGLPIDGVTTVLMALGLAAAAAAPLLARWLEPLAPTDPRGRESPRRVRPPWEVIPLLVVLALVAWVHATPHLPPVEEGAEGQRLDEGVLATLLERTQNATRYPYAIHVDEHVHWVRAAQVVDTGTILADHPYTGEPAGSGVFSLQQQVHERGFWTALAQFHLLTGIPLGAVFRFGPAVWAAGLAAITWGLTRPHPGALAAALATVALPTTLLILGVGFLVPITVGLGWVLATLWVAARCNGLARLGGTLFLVTSAFLIHLVAGGLCLLVALAAVLVRPGPWNRRLLLAALTLLPLLWIGPAVAVEVTQEVGEGADYPSARELFLEAGLPLQVMAIGGAVVAFARARKANLPHRIAAIVLVVVAAALNLSLMLSERSLAIYYRPLHAYFLAVALLAGLFVGELGLAAKRFAGQGSRGLAVAVALVLILPTVPTQLEARLEEPYYRVHDEGTWATMEAASQHVGPGDRFLSHPWQAPLFVAATGALPVTYLEPGRAPVQANLYGFYIGSGGANPAWFEENGITVVLHDRRPNTEHTELGPGVYRVAPPSPVAA
ncbi:MAG: hypothetical protein ACPGQL_03870, partial [Thermoplasmatota archaeon]